MIQVRLATQNDIQGIMAVEQETFGELGNDAMASREMMRNRVKICNETGSGWFWVAEYKNKIVGDAILEPTSLMPRECTSWSAATDGGKFIKTFQENGANLFAASMAVSNSAPLVAADLLVFPTIVRWLETGKKYFMFCSRISGFKDAHEKTGIAVEEYWQLKDLHGNPSDPALNFLCRCVAAKPMHLQKNGFPPDKESCGHSVLCAGDDPVRALKDIAARIYYAARVSKQKIGVKII